MKLLTVDWDYFFYNKLFTEEPDCLLYDWVHRETPLFIYSIWEVRASSFLRYGLKLPQTTGEEKGFWSHFKFSKKAKLYYGESHLLAASSVIRDLVTEVWSFDAHHDTGYEQSLPMGMVTCDNWLGFYKSLGADRLHIRYPLWNKWVENETPSIPLDYKFADPKELEGVVFRLVVVCRSGAWVPSWLDNRFNSFLESCPIREKICLEKRGSLPPRNFDLNKSREMARLEEVSH